MARLGAEVTGIDPSSENVAVASSHAQGDPLTRGIRYEAATAEHLDARGREEEAGCDFVVTGVLLEEMRECGRCRQTRSYFGGGARTRAFGACSVFCCLGAMFGDGPQMR